MCCDNCDELNISIGASNIVPSAALISNLCLSVSHISFTRGGEGE